MSVKMKIRVTKEILERSSMCAMFRDIDGKVKRIGDNYSGYKNLNPSPTQYIHDNNIAGNCAVALAVRELFPDALVGGIAIQPFGARLAIDAKMDIRMPKIAENFIVEFDDAAGPITRQMMPELEFEVDIPDCVIDKLELPDLSEYLKESKTLELV